VKGVFKTCFISIPVRFKKLSALKPRLGCRTMDILHVACACQLKPQLFISFDHRQQKLGEAAGLSVQALN
jgi:hypothetical protein